MRPRSVNLITLTSIITSIMTSVMMAAICVTWPLPSRAAKPNNTIAQLTIAQQKYNLQIEQKNNYQLAFTDRDLVVIKANTPWERRAKADAYRAALSAACNARPGYIKQVALEYPPSLVGFDAALAISAAMQLKGNPVGIKSWFDHSIVDPNAWASFAAFVAGNAAFSRFLQATGATFDPCTVLRKTPRGKPIELTPTRAQKAMALLAGPISMAAGMVASTFAADVLSDKNLQVCAAGLINRQTPEARAVADAACDQAFRTWTLSNKIDAYAPATVSGFTTALALGLANGLVVNKFGLPYLPAPLKARATGALVGATFKAVDLAEAGVIRLGAVQLVSRIGAGIASLSPYARAGLIVGNLLIFFGLEEQIRPFVVFPINVARDATLTATSMREIVRELDRAEAANWKWQPTPMPALCNLPGQQNILTENDVVTVNFLPQADCRGTVLSPGALIARLHQEFKHWRAAQTADADAKSVAWRDYVLEFSAHYSGAYRYYSKFIDQIKEQQRSPEYPQPIYRKQLYFGLPLPPVKFICDFQQDSDAIGFIRDSVRLADRAVQLLESRPLTRGAITEMQTIADGLRALDCAVPFTQAQFNQVKAANPKLASYPADKQVEYARFIRLHSAMQTLDKVLRLSPMYGVQKSDVKDQASYQQLAKRNPFVAIQLWLGTPGARSSGSLWANAPTNLGEPPEALFTPEEDALHPTKLARVATNSMGDYMLASMACGPDADPSIREKKERASWPLFFDRMARLVTSDRVLALKDWLDLDNDELTPEDMLVIDRKFADDVNPRPTIFHFKSPRVIDVAMFPKQLGWSVHFRPPRVIGGSSRQNVCATGPRDGGKSVIGGDDLSPYNGTWAINGRSFNGLPELVRSEVRPEVIADFSGWWSRSVDQPTIAMVTEFQKRFNEVVAKHYLPKFVDKRAFALPGSSEKIKALSFGIAPSILDELELNLNYLSRALAVTTPNGTLGEPSARELQSLQQEVRNLFRIGLKFISKPSDVRLGIAAVWHGFDLAKAERDSTIAEALAKRAGLKTDGQFDQNDQFTADSFEIWRRILAAKLEQLKKLSAESVSAVTDVQRQSVISEVQRATIHNLSDLAFTLDSLFGLLSTAQIQGLVQN